MTDTNSARRSWVESANDGATDFPIQNLPFGVFSRTADGARRVGVAIGDMVLDVVATHDEGLLDLSAAVREACDSPALNAMMSFDASALALLRGALADALDAASDRGRRAANAASSILAPSRDVTMHVPAAIGDYSDFYASIHHATNVGTMLRPDNPLLPNYKYVPIGYHGRASSIVPSGSRIARPSGQTRDDAASAPAFGPTRRLDYELEVGAFIARGNALGSSVPVDDAESRVFGLCLVNDWSARDMQTWEYQPLGPFLAKSFATTVSPWVVSLEALTPFRRQAFTRPSGDPAPLPYLSSSRDQARGGFDITLEVLLSSARMRESHVAPMRVSRGDFGGMYWTFAQMIAHHTSNGCNLRPGDLIASGTVSGEAAESRGCLLERTWRGTEPLQLPTGERRTFLEDGDEVIMRAWCEKPGAVRIGFGECRGIVG